MPIDRETTVKKADKLLRQGNLDGAIEEYVRLVEDQPNDWTAINALGDLYMRAGDVQRAVTEFTRVADRLFSEGFLPKAAALYKKSLKVHPQHEHTLSQLTDIAVRQGLLVDAKTYLRQLEQVRRLRGDEVGVAECLTRLRGLGETADAPAPLPPRPAAAAGPRPAEPPDSEADGLFARAQSELASGNEQSACAILTRVLTIDPQRHLEVTEIALDLARSGRVESAFGCIDLVADAALLEGNLNRAVEALQAFVSVTPHIPALIKLVEICVEAGLDEAMRSAQAQLADAYLTAGRGVEARVISVDLLEGNPDCNAHAERLTRALELLGVSDPGRFIADVRARCGSAVPWPDAVEGREDEAVPIELVADPEPAAGAPPEEDDVTAAHQVETYEAASALPLVDVEEYDAPTAVRPVEEYDAPTAVRPVEEYEAAAADPVEADEASAADPEIDLSDTLTSIGRPLAAPRPTESTERYEAAVAHLEAGRVEDAIWDFEAAARVPRTRVKATTELGRLYIRLGDLEAGVKWLERAADGPAATPEEGFAVMYELADALERLGEPTRALAVLVDLEADAGEYRDIRARIEQLSRAQTGSHGG